MADNFPFDIGDDRSRCRVVRALVGERSVSCPLKHMVGGEMKDRILTVGIIGTIVAAICCFTPVLVILLGTLGLSAAIGYLDIVVNRSNGAALAISNQAVIMKQAGNIVSLLFSKVEIISKSVRL